MTFISDVSGSIKTVLMLSSVIAVLHCHEMISDKRDSTVDTAVSPAVLVSTQCKRANYVEQESTTAVLHSLFIVSPCCGWKLSQDLHMCCCQLQLVSGVSRRDTIASHREGISSSHAAQS